MCLIQRGTFVRILGHTYLSVFLASFLASSCAAEVAHLSVENFTQAWAKHKSGISSFMCECELTELHTVYKNDASKRNDPFLDATKGTPMGVHEITKYLKLKVQDDKVYRHVEGEAWDSVKAQPAKHEWVFASNGNILKKLVYNKLLPFGMGSFGKPESVMRNSISDEHSYPFWIWCDPEKYLHRYRPDLNAFRISRNLVPIEGKDCFELSAFHGKLIISVLVDRVFPVSMPDSWLPNC